MKIRQSEPVFCSQEILSWERKSCKQFPPGALQVAKEYCERVTPPLQLAMFSVVIVTRQVARKIASCNMAFISTDESDKHRSASFVIGSFQTARQKTMSRDGCRKIAVMHITLNAAISHISHTNSCNSKQGKIP